MTDQEADALDEDPRPILRCLVALPGLFHPPQPHAFAVISILDWPLYQKSWQFIALDPEDHARWQAWRERHQDA